MAAATVIKSRSLSFPRLILSQILGKPCKSLHPPHLSWKISNFPHIPSPRNAKLSFPGEYRDFSSGRTIQELLAEVERDRDREREERKKAGLDYADIDAEEDEDYMGVGPLIEKLEKEKLKDTENLYLREEPTDSDSDEDDEWNSPQAIKRRKELFEKKFKRHEELLRNYTKSESIDEAFDWMHRIDNFEKKHFQLRPEYRVMGELLNRLKVATGKDKFLLQQKLNRALRLVEWKEAYDPNDPANYGFIKDKQVGPRFNREKQFGQAADEYEQFVDIIDDDEEFDDMKKKDDLLFQKLDAIDKELEEKLANLDHTFGRKGKVLEEEIRNLAEERNSLTENIRKPLYRKGFDVKLIHVNRTTKVTKGGRVRRYTVMLACGNYHGVIGFAKAKGPTIPVAFQKAYEKCFQNLHYIDRYEEHTIAQAVQADYKATKVHLWPASTQTGVKAGRTVQTILSLAGFKNVKSKVLGSKNPHNTVKALFIALNAIETPKDIQEKFGRTVVESNLL